MMRTAKRENRPAGRAYRAQRPYQPRAVPARAHIAEPAARRRGAGEAKPGRLSFKAFLSEPFRILRTVTPLQAALLCIAVILCISVPVALAASIGASPGPAAPDAQGQGQPAPPPDGYSAASASPDPASSSSPTASPTSTPPPDPASAVIREGVSAPVVAEIQSRLMALGYMEEDEPTEYFGPITSSAVSLFQRQHHLTVDGAMGPESYTLLMSDDAQKYTVMEGASGEDVKELQARLRELGYLDTVTGNFGELTTKAVKNFQECNSLTVDGKVGQKTLDLLYSADVKPYFLKYGEQSDMVKTYQKRLATLGYLTTEPDGKYGKYTVAAVKRFQEINGLIPDGFLGPNTVSLLTSGKAHANALVLGMKGDDVKSMQNLLKALGYMSHVTGYYGSETESAVKAFQKRNGLTVDGTVGKQTMTLLKSGKAKKAASGSSGSSGNNGSSGNSGSGSSSPSSGVEKLISVAESKLGKKYVSGAKGPNTFDCSGFVYYCLNQAGVKQGYLTSDGWAACGKYQKITSISSLKRGDILVFGAHSAGHVGIYLGNGCMIDASSANGKVVKRTGIWSSSYWPGEFICAFRVY